MARRKKSIDWNEVLELLADNAAEGLPQALKTLLEQAALVERARALGAQAYQRTDQRTGYANGFKPKTLHTRLGPLTVQVPQARGIHFYPQCMLKGLRAERALRLALAEMYIQGVSTRKVNAILEELCGTEVTSVEVSRAAALLDEQLQQWRERPLDACPYLIVDARYEKVRVGSSVYSWSLLLAVGIRPDGRRMVLGLSVSCSEAEVHWRQFLRSLQSRGLRQVRYIVSDAHAGLKEALGVCFPGAVWQRCQFHLMQDALAHVPRKDQRAAVAADLREVFDAPDLQQAQVRLGQVCLKYAHWPQLVAWLEETVPQSLQVFALPEAHRKRLRTSNLLERLNKELKRRTRVVGIFPHAHSLLRLASAVLVQYSEQWEAADQPYLEMNP